MAAIQEFHVGSNEFRIKLSFAYLVEKNSPKFLAKKAALNQ